VFRGILGKRKAAKVEASAFGTIFATPWSAEYRGEIPATPGVIHNLFAVAITPSAGQVLLAEGFRPIAGTLPTHTIKCNTSMVRDSYHPRALFDLFFDLSSFPPNVGLWLSIEACKRLKRRLFTCTEKALLIRCRTENEFPWCCDNETLDIAWLDDGSRCMELAIAEYQRRIGVK